MIKRLGAFIGIFFLYVILDIIINSDNDGARSAGVIILLFIIVAIGTRNWD